MSCEKNQNLLSRPKRALGTFLREHLPLSLVINHEYSKMHEIKTAEVLGVDTGFVQQSFGVQVQVLSRWRR